MKQIIITIFLFLLLSSFNITPAVAAQNDIIGKAAPSFTVLDLNGKEVSLSDFNGKVVILDFWATWCPPCVKEIPHFIELYKEYKNQGLAILGISVDQQGIGVVKAFNKKYKINYPIVMANRQVVNGYSNIRSIPTTFVIDPAGKIRRMYVGYREKSVFEADIKALLPGASSGQRSTGTENNEAETKPNEYITELNEIGMAGRSESENASPYYQRAIELYVNEPEGLEVSTKQWPQELPVKQHAMLKKWVKDNSKSFEQLQLASRKPYYWLKYTGKDIQTTEMPHLRTQRQLAIALQARAMLSAEDGNVTSALKDIVTLYTVGAQISAGPKLLPEKLLGIAVKGLPIRAVFNILDRKMLDAASMKSLENRLKLIAAEYDEPLDIRSEKLYLQEQIETNPRFSSFKKHLKSTLEYYDTTVAKTPMQLHSEPAQSANNENPLQDSATIAKVIEIEYRSKADMQALIKTLAILRYHSDKNGYPETLSQLITAGYLKELPKDPFSDKPLVYKRTQKSFMLYSFGADFDDDGGQYSNWGYDENGGDQVFWPVKKGP